MSRTTRESFRGQGISKKISRQNKTLEQLLNEALVPEEEQPYEVPANWLWTKLGYFAQFERGITFPAAAKENSKGEGLIGCARTANIQEEFDWEDLIYIDSKYLKDNREKLVKIGDILMSSANSYNLVGKVVYVEDLLEEIAFGGFLLCLRTKSIEPRFLYYLLKYMFLSGEIQKLATQTTNIANINTTSLEELLIALPNIAEQIRIVYRVELLLAKINEARGLLEEARETFTNRRAAILAKAFRGELTRKWREEHPDVESAKKLLQSISVQLLNDSSLDSIPPTWAYCHLGEYVENHDGKRVPVALQTRNNRKGKFPYYGASGIIDYIDGYTHEGEYLLIAEDGANLLTRTKPIAFIARDKFWVNNHAHVVKCKGDIPNEYLSYYLNSIDLSNYVTGTAQPKLTQKNLKIIPIPVPPLEEQLLIVEILTNIFQSEEVIKESYAQVEKVLDATQQAILAKAFRGELGTNNLEEESALKLLRDVLKEKTKMEI